MVQEEKKIFFITDRIDHDPLIYKSSKIAVIKNPCQLDEWLADHKNAGYDIEANGNRIYLTQMLLVQIGDRDTQFVIDCTSDATFEACKLIINKHAETTLFFAHNGKYDFVHSYTNGIYLDKLFDTMIAEQRIYLGRTDIDYNYASLMNRYLNIFLDKSVRADFLKMNKKSKFMISHIIYGAKDISRIIDIARLQKTKLESYGQYEWFKTVENPLVITIGEIELEGIECYPDKWREIIKKKEKQVKEQNVKLNNEVSKLYTQYQPHLVTTDLFGTSVMVENSGKKKINFNSPQQITKIIGRTNNGIVPMFKEKGKSAKESAREAAIQQFLIEYPKTHLRSFLTEYLSFKEYKKFLSSYGEKFLNTEIVKKGKKELGYLNSFTHRVHTIYRQCSTDTGRLASGDVDAGYFNSQNVPKEKEIREGFGLTEEEIKAGYYLTTCDLSGAEATIMSAFADEQAMYDLAILKDDVHSPIATACWQAVYMYRLKNGLPLEVHDTRNSMSALLSDVFLIDKKNNKPMRDDFKNFTFGAIYGMKDNKGAQTLNVSKVEAQIMIDVIKSKFPRIFKMVEEAAQCAYADGYVILNCVSNNRRWFTPVITIHEMLDIADRTLRYHRTKDELHFNDMIEIEGAARNVRIQGTQADMMKEAMVRIRDKCRELTRKGFDVGQGAVHASVSKELARIQFAQTYNISPFGRQKLSIHDETVTKHKSKEFGTDIADIITNTANRYLEPYSKNIRMKCSYESLTNWTK